MSEAEDEVEVYEEYGGPSVGRSIVVERNDEDVHRFMNIGGIAVVPFEDTPEWVIEALVENGYEYTHH